MVGYVHTAGTLECHRLHISCGKVLLPHEAILSLHTVLFLPALLEPVEQAMQFQKVVHTKR